MFPNIMNQESSSEAIAAYEAVAMFGKVMASIFQKSGDSEKALKAEMIQNVGLSLTATEVRSAQKYWHVLQNIEESNRIYPSTYEASVVGILWGTFIQFGTWFGSSPYLIYGIQLLPLTPVAEARDDVTWAKEIYSPLAASCDQACVSEGWAIQVFAILATIGHPDLAVEQTLQLSPSVYEGPGGNGHSKSNTLWYIATRPNIQNPYPEENLQLIDILDLTCSQPSTCTPEYLGSMAGDYSCRARIEWLMNVEDMSESMACAIIAGDEYRSECGLCNPDGPSTGTEDDGEESSNAEATATPTNEGTTSIPSNQEPTASPSKSGLTCFQPQNCTNMVLDRMAGDVTCRDRIEYLISAGELEERACEQVAGVEYPLVCGECMPNR